MKVWIDLSNSPHVAFMRPFVRKFVDDGVAFVITARDYGNTIDLAAAEGWEFHVVGGHGGKSALGKFLAFLQRTGSLALFLRRHRPTVAFSQSSFYSPLVARILGIPFVYTNDNEFAKGNLLGRLPGGVSVYPSSLRTTPQASFFLGRNSCFFDGVKEAIYLSQEKTVAPKPGEKPVLYYRPEPWLAQYHEASPEFSVDIVRTMQTLGDVRLVCRDRAQRNYYQEIFANADNVAVINTVVTLEDIVQQASAFVGSGGTMCRELALLGVPTVSLYTGELLSVDRALIKAGLMRHTRDPMEMKAFLNRPDSQVAHNASADAMLRLGAAAFREICRRVYALGGR